MTATRIVALCDRPDLIAKAAAVMADIWPAHYGPGQIGNAVDDLRARNRQTGLPYGLLAVTASGHVVGGGALATQSFGQLAGEELWIVGLFVHPDHRRCGIASTIVQALEIRAAHDGHQSIHATTSLATTLLMRLGWTIVRRTDDDPEDGCVLRKVLSRPDQ